jgi:hypothetical protein
VRIVTRRRLQIGSLASSVLLIAAGTVWAATINGTPGNDTLRGGAAKDKLYGKGGNDRLYGRAGNDLLVGGSGHDVLVGGPGNDLLVGGLGADKLSCGSGRDTANAGVKDKVATDCEVVKGIPTNPPPPPPSPPPLPPPPQPLPRPQPGIYCGFTEQGPGLCVTTTADASAVMRLRTSSIVDCTPVSRWTWTRTIFRVGAPILSDLSFSFSYTGPLTSSSTDVTNIQTSQFVKGVFRTDGKAEGTLAISTISFDYQGQHYDCGQSPVRWSVTRQV